MIAIEDIACAFPARSLSNEELRAAYPEWDFDRLESERASFAGT